jgi:uncharacterized membrane protein
VRRVADLLVGQAASALEVMAGGYGLAFCVWAIAHQDQLGGLILNNQLAPEARSGLLRALLMGAGLTILLWIAAVLVFWRNAPDATRRARFSAAIVFGLAGLGFLPILALPDLQNQQPFLTFGLILGLALIAFASTNQALRLWQPAPGLGAPAEAVEVMQRSPQATVRSYRAGLAVAACLSLAYIAFMSVLTVARHNAFMTHSFDLGIHDQVVYNVLHSGYLRSTQHGADPINYLREHFSPILYLLAPIYALYQDARTLLVLQSILLGLGAIPVYLLAQRKTANTSLALAFSASFLLLPALHGVNTFDFHQIVPATVLILFCLYFLETGRTVPFLIALGLALLTKEEVALTAAAIGLYVFLAKRRYGLGAAIMALSLIYFVAVVGFIMPALGGAAQVNRFSGIMAPGSTGLAGVFKTLLTNPWYVVPFIVTNPAKLLYLFQLLVPVLFLPLLGGITWLVVAPPLALALLSSAETQYTIGFHYPATVVPGIFFMAIFGSLRLNPERCRRPALALAVLVASLAMNYEYGQILGKNFSGIPQPTPHQVAAGDLIRAIPAGASVSAMGDLVPHLSSRRDIYLFPIVNAADYVFLDTDHTASFWPFIERSGRDQAQVAVAPYLLSGDYGLAQAHDGYLLLKKGADTARNMDGLRTLFSTRYEAESLRGAQGGRDVLDTQASGGMARLGTPDMPLYEGKAALTYGPYDALWPGKYRVTFWLKLTGNTTQGKVATLDVFSNAAGGQLAAKDLRAESLNSGGSYQPFTVDLETNQLWTDLEYRVLYYGKGDLAVDYVEVVPLRINLPDNNQVLQFTDSAGS